MYAWEIMRHSYAVNQILNYGKYPYIFIVQAKTDLEESKF